MKLTMMLVTVVSCCCVMVGCGKAPDPTDTAFESQLAQAAAENKNPPKTKRRLTPGNPPAKPDNGSPAGAP